MQMLWENLLVITLTYLPFGFLYIRAFRKELRFSKKTSLCILLISAVARLLFSYLYKMAFIKIGFVFNLLDLCILLFFGILVVKSRPGRMMFIALMLKNTADALVVIAKSIEYAIWPKQALTVYNWTYSLIIILCELITVPILYRIIQKYFTLEIREVISRSRWSYLWIIPMFFYVTWIYVFYFASTKSKVQLACMPSNAIFLLCSIICQYLIYICLATLVQSLQTEVELRNENHAITMQKLQYEYIKQQITEDRKLRHDMRHHFQMISSLAQSGDIEKLTKYIDSYIAPTLWQSQVHYCSNTVLNLLISYYADKCSHGNIDFQAMISLPQDLPLSDTDITILFGNLLENAYDACLSLPPDVQRKIVFRGSVLHQELLFSIENTYSQDQIKKIGHVFYSTKHTGEGVGTASCRDIVHQYGASIEFLPEELFRVNIIFHMNAKKTVD